MAANEKEREVTFELKEHIGVLSAAPTGWSKELNLVSWNGKAEKYDIREWCDNHTRMRKGATLTEEEMRALFDLMKGLDLESGPETGEEASSGA